LVPFAICWIDCSVMHARLQWMEMHLQSARTRQTLDGGGRMWHARLDGMPEVGAVPIQPYWAAEVPRGRNAAGACGPACVSNRAFSFLRIRRIFLKNPKFS
jgi:hypothetical protein